MNYIDGILEKYGLNLDELLILIVSFTVFLPFYFLIFAFNALFFYLIVSGKIIPILKGTPYVKNVLSFTLLIFVVSVFKHNLYGIGVSIIIFEFAMFFMYYRSVINRKLFSRIINLYMIVSIFCFILTILSVLYSKFSMDLKMYEFIEYMALHRPVSSFFNTNYYATICEFIIIIAMYYFLSNKNKNNRLYFLCVSTLAFIVLFLTENRTALPTILIATLVLSLTKNNKKVFAFLGIFTVIIVILMIFSNRIFPRYEFIGNSLGTRKEIWDNAIKLFKQTFLFGSGPMAYQNATWVTHPANHAHNIALDVLINFGIVGILVISPLFVGIVKQVYSIRKRNLFRLIIALTVVVVLHGMLDVTILWHQTAYIYFSVLLAVGKVSNFESKFIF
ncbi:O-antigen ligase family protein [Parvimonas sp. D2]|uniref:O-antigen ligase family protein n=1 Tax=unclassified Parvimonas TaxID=1151464 RepID=UPI002B49FF10|nr:MULTISPECIES: O-antigen ligase family protein [unclassified Parvimonas]MEB3012497.1 O-antigen ligase family protein [Parvimonas sp. D2]